MDCAMMEASNLASASVQTVTYREYLPTEPIYRDPSLEGHEETRMETAADDLRLGEVRSNTENSMDQLQNSFQKILHLQVEEVTVASVQTEPSSTTESSSSSLGLSLEEDFIGYHRLTVKACEDLKCIAFRMNSKGRLDKLVSVYVKERKSFMNVYFRKLWDEKLGCRDIQRLEWKVMEIKIMRWIRAADYSFRRIYACEKQLSHQVFKELGNATDESCFVSTVTDSATRLFVFAEAVSSCPRSPERLLTVLLLYRRFSGLMPEINCIFDSEKAKSIRDRAGSLLGKFAEVVKSALLDFEDAVLRERSNDHVPGGTIHRLTKYVMDYTTTLIAENKAILMGLITPGPWKSLGPLNGCELQGQTPLATYLLRIITALKLNLEVKSECYPNPSLSHLFMMNNVHYIAQQIGQSEVLREMVGNDHIRKLTENVEMWLTSYLRITWNDLVYCLRNDGLHVSCGFTSWVSESVPKERFKTFNTMFQKIRQTHSEWAVPDLELRRKLQRSILD